MRGPSRGDRERQPLAQAALRWSAVGVGALVLTLGTNFFRPTLLGLQLSADIVERSRQYHDQIRNNDALEQENIFLRTEPGKRWAVRRYTGMVRPGETVGQVVAETAEAPRPLTSLERFWSWEARLEAAGTKRWRELGEMAGCYGGLRARDEAPNNRNRQPGELSEKVGEGGDPSGGGVSANGKPGSEKPAQ
jgi:hypothetical protein